MPADLFQLYPWNGCHLVKTADLVSSVVIQNNLVLYPIMLTFYCKLTEEKAF